MAKLKKKKRSIWPWVIGGILVIGGINALNKTGSQTAATQAPATPVGQNFGEEFNSRAALAFSTLQDTNGSSDGIGVVNLKPRTDDYYTSGDKINKIMAVESARLFRSVAGLKELKINLPSEGKSYTLDLTQQQAQDHYGLDFSNMSLDQWQSDFLPKFDSKEARASFAQKFVKVE